MIGADELQRVEDIKYLGAGVVIYNKLRFNKNTNKQKMKVNSTSLKNCRTE
jgi:hypothetical protein